MTTELPQVIVDANVLLSLLTDRNEKQRADGRELLKRAARGEVAVILGVSVVDDCPWPEFFDHWSDLRPDIGDAAILALAVTKHYCTLATFDRGLVKRAKTFGVSPYW